MKTRLYFLTTVMILAVPINCLAWAFGATWDKNFEDDLCCYRIYICSDEKRAIEKNADIATLTVPNVSQPSFEFYDVPDNLRSVYVAVTAVNNSNEESNPAFCSLSPGYAIRKPTVLKATSIK